ncbi:hypothetical protein SAMN04489712_106135 [Thermomonospora echinospora]|uniref:Uncharacterized protein n=1 Tax=Thermomonospora echinospora TaxID=1992 RepID=A0A1H6AZP8_9ACTN|nr:hypothetical protein [Thermomonospora echinospora]SEG54083.1 hypothetical protein SAMN04489712_106135 [Thermomonospora echinospora]
MQDDLEALEDRIARLRRSVRAAMRRRDSARVKELRAELRRVERAWDELADALERDERQQPSAPEPARPPGPLVPAREHVHQVLTLLGVPAAPKLIGAVHRAFFPGELPASRLASLRRDEERSFRSSPGARPYYLCPALTSDLLAPARGLVTVSSWPLEHRIIGPLSPRVDFLRAAVAVADAAQRGLHETPDTERLLRSFAVSIPGATPRGTGPIDPGLLTRAAEAEIAVHLDADRQARAAAADRARRRLDETERLFGTKLRAIPGKTAQG